MWSGAGRAREQTAQDADETGQDGREDALDRIGGHLLDVGDHDAGDAGEEANAEQNQDANADFAPRSIADEPCVEIAEFEAVFPVGDDDLARRPLGRRFVQGRMISAMDPSARWTSILPPLLVISR